MKYILLLFLACFTYTLRAQSDTIVDPRDGQKYSVVEINGLLWFQQNLNFRTADSDCFIDESIACGMWGRLYSKQEAPSACPKGWRLPTVDDWQKIDTIDIFTLVDTVYWQNNKRHTNTTGLSLQPSGIMHKRKFWNQYLNSTLWFQDLNNPESHWHLHVHGENNPETTHVFHTHAEKIKVRKFAIRCVQDQILD